MTESETIAWLAGILEGEGCFQLVTVRNNSGVYYYPQIIVGMSDEDVIQKIADLFETKTAVTYRGEYKPSYRAIATGSRAVKWMRLVYPYMGKRRKAKIEKLGVLTADKILELF